MEREYTKHYIIKGRICKVGTEFVFGNKSNSKRLKVVGERGVVLERYYTLNYDYRNRGWRNYSWKVKVLSGKKKGKVYHFNGGSPL